MTLTQKTMTSILKIFPSFFFIALLVPFIASAQGESLTLSVSPTLFDMTANPEQEWVSTVRVINANPYEITVYADVMNFASNGESGQPKFLPLDRAESGGQTLADWVRLEKTELVIPAEQTMEVPFRIVVPGDAPPGGHFAAVMIGTKSLDTGGGQTAVETSQVVTSLIFLRVTGNIIEDGVIREFRGAQRLVEKPAMDFDLRFQNKGNVHILPQGEIKIFNMWGEERGVIPVNRYTLFGNVLPGSVRNYSFSWSGEWSLADIGRYTAVATLAYGQDGRQFATSETSFWVLPWKIALLVLGLLTAFVLFMTWAIKLYVRRMLALAGVAPGSPYGEIPSTRRRSKRVSVVAPLEEGMLDLRQRISDSEGWGERASSMFVFIRKYRVFFMVVVAVVAFTAVVVWYVQNASVSDRLYEVTIDGTDENITISSEQLEYETRKTEASDDEAAVPVVTTPPIKIVNQSGVPGLAAALRLRLESLGYEVKELTNDLERTEMNTVIVYAPEFDEAALALSGLVYGALLSSYAEAAGTETPIIIYVGKDLENAVQ